MDRASAIESMSLGASLGASMSSMSQWGLIHPNSGWLAALTSLILTF